MGSKSWPRDICTKALSWKVVHVHDILERSHTTEQQRTLSSLCHKDRDKASSSDSYKNPLGVLQRNKTSWKWLGFFFRCPLWTWAVSSQGHKKERMWRNIYTIKIVFGGISKTSRNIWGLLLSYITVSLTPSYSSYNWLNITHTDRHTQVSTGNISPSLSPAP